MTRVQELESELAAAKREVTRIKRELVLARHDPPTRKCITCNQSIPREHPNGVRIPPGEYAQRKYCSTTCVGHRRRESGPTRKCGYCGRPISRVAPNGQWRSPAEYAARDYCCKSHALKARYAKPKGRAARALLNRESVLAVVREYRGLPLTAEEVCDHLGLTPNSRSKAAKILKRLVSEGEISVKSPGLYFDSAAWEAAA